MKIRLVDGAKIRNTTNTDFAGFATHAYDSAVPKGELWIEDYLKPERDLMVHIVETEQRYKRRTFASIRARLQKEAAKHGTPPPFIKKRERRGSLAIIHVDGAVVRKYIDPYFFLGGHDLVYAYIPKNEIWIDALNSAKDTVFTLIHELHERALMARGMDYASAHDYALAEERYHRRKQGVARFTNN
ncbi:MAG: hypothetical protein HY437_01970 [Candidatus Magasanikbacteria bacterium]|nr:hypothetical protein [Candidatus Magasanikbacteria bacterium]